MYDSQKWERVFQVYTNIILIRISNSESVKEYIVKLNGFFNQLIQMKEPIIENFKIAIFLGSLPEKFEVKYQVLYEKEKLIYEDITEIIIQYEDTMISTEE